MITSRLTTKAQTTIPRAIRAALHLREGDELVYQIDGDRVILSKAHQNRVEDDPFRSFGEWDSQADNKAYANKLGKIPPALLKQAINKLGRELGL